MKELTNAEEEVMQILWELKEAFVKDIIEQMPEPRPAYNTVSTIVRILEKKGFVAYESYGKTHKYYPLVKKEDYSRRTLKKVVKNYFNDSYKQMVSFFSKDKELTLNELEEIKKIFEEQIAKQKGK